MPIVLPILTDEEVKRCLSAGEETGFGSLRTPQGLLPLKAMDVQTRIDGLLAHTTLSQTFVNTSSEPLEATYIFPLPDRAAVTQFRMEVAGRVVEGLLQERGEARRTYDQAIQEGRRAAITEEERPGVFTIRVGNLMPGEEAAIRLTLTGPLVYSDGEVTFRFPLVVAPRYIPGTPLPGPAVGDGVASDTDAVPDASRITPPVLLPGFPSPVRLSLGVEVQAGALPMSDFKSSLHAVLVDESGSSRRITLNPGERLNRDFILRFRLGDQAVQTSFVLAPDANGKGNEGTFQLTIVPPVGAAKQQRPRDLIFILDRSGSMGGWKMVAARRALARMVDTLNEQDHFTVFAFDNDIETPPAFAGKMVPATDRNRFRAVEFLAGIEARGGTEMTQPLDRAVAALASAAAADRDRLLVLVTDGQVGNEDQILHSLGKRVQGMRIFTLGIDQAVNAAFLRRLASLGGGLCELVESEDRLDEVMDKIHRRLGPPVLTGLHVEPAGLRVDRETMVPARLPDLFAGAPLVIQGRYRDAGKASVTIQATDAAARPRTDTITATTTDNPAIGAVWARGRIRELEDRYVTGHGDNARLEKQIVTTSLQFSVLSRFTAFVAVDVKEVVNPDGKVHRVTQPVEAAAGWAMLGTDAEEVAGCMGSFRAGVDAFKCMSAPSAPMAACPAPPPSAAPAEKLARVRRSASPAPNLNAGPPVSSGPSKKRGGVLGAVGGILFGRGEVAREAEVPPPPESIDLTAYRRRAKELLDRLQGDAGKPPADRLQALGVLAVQLDTLVEDLRSIGADEATVRPLGELLAELRTLLATTAPPETEITRTWKKAEEVLKGLAEGVTAAAPAPARREGFWK